MKYPVSQPLMKGNEKKYLLDCVKTNMISSAGAYVQRFEQAFAREHINAQDGQQYGVACSSGTNALVLALRAIGVKQGDEVIVPEFTMVASAWAVTMCGATPVFVDCDSEMKIDWNKIEDAITEKTVAIMPVHIYGRRCNMEKIMEIAHDYGLRVIEDSAEAHGVPLRGDIACFSLYANKIITSGEGGICITRDPYLAEQMCHLRGMAFNKDHTFHHKKLGYNFRMTNMQAAIALAQTEQLENILMKRKQIEAWYDEELKDIPVIKVLAKRDVLWMYDLLVPPNIRGDLMHRLALHGIETRVFFKPMSMQPMYKGNVLVEGLLAYRRSLEGFYLPTYTSMSRKDVRFICRVIRKFIKEIESKK